MTPVGISWLWAFNTGVLFWNALPVKYLNAKMLKPSYMICETPKKKLISVLLEGVFSQTEQM
jgi:hypothetical protein